jgi:hypothetical protein
MKRTQVAQYSLLASAFVLAALTLLQASRLIDNRAQAAMAVNKDAVTMITAESPLGGGDEILYILDSSRGRLFAYSYNLNNKAIEPFAVMEIASAFKGAGDGKDTGRKRAPGR